MHNISGPSGPLSLDQGQVTALLNALQADPTDLGVGLYNPSTGQIHLGSFDQLSNAGFAQGHQGLADFLGITDTTRLQGFVVDANGRFAPMSHFNQPHTGSMAMPPADALRVEQALRQAGLVR